MLSSAIDTTRRKRARYVADTIGLVLRHHKYLRPDQVIAFTASVGQLRFIRAMLNKVAKR